MKKLFAAAALVGIATLSYAAQNRTDVVDRADAAAKVLQEIMATPDKGIPGTVLNGAKCVAVVPSLKQAGFVFGGKYGRGVATCKTAQGWSAPAPFTIAGGSWGLQIGGQAVDLVMLIMNQQGMQQLLASKFKIGADVSGAAGPVGRQASANTDWKLRSQVLTYSRSRGAFAGITLNGASIKQDDDSTRALYGKQESFTAILDGEVPVPAGGEAFVKQVAEAQKQAREPQNENASAGTSGGATGAVSTPNTPSKDNGNAGAVGTNTNQK